MFFSLLLSTIYYTPELIKLEGIERKTFSWFTTTKLLRLDDFDINSTCAQAMFATFNGLQLLLLFWIINPHRIASHFDKRKMNTYKVGFYVIMTLAVGFLLAALIICTNFHNEWKLFTSTCNMCWNGKITSNLIILINIFVVPFNSIFFTLTYFQIQYRWKKRQN